MAPFLRDRDHLSLAQTGFLISSSLIGSIVSLIPWGLATDRIGERLVLFVGVLLCGVALVAAGFAHGFWALTVLLILAGGIGASVQSASGRAVLHWFPPAQRGLALALRQTAVPLSGFAISVVLPPIVHAGGVRWGFITLGASCIASAILGALVLREGPRPDEAVQTVLGPAPIRDPRIWRLSIGSALLIAPQLCVAGFTVLYLHDRRGMSAGGAAAVLAVMQALAVGGRISAGRWSDVHASRLAPLRAIALAAFAFVILLTLVLDAPLALLIPVLVVAGVLSMSWNSLSFAAAVELAGHGRSGAAIGLQQTLLNGPGAAYPGLFGVLVAVSSWRVGFAVVALFPLAGWRVLKALPG
ncbi:MAG: MFS transporter [Thermoleophilia bacterium]|nr:MFS transporter [Thermoleophilia bacterium]